MTIETYNLMEFETCLLFFLFLWIVFIVDYYQKISSPILFAAPATKLPRSFKQTVSTTTKVDR